MSNRVLEFERRPELCLCGSGARLADLLDAAKELSSNEEFLLVLDYDRSLIGRVLPAYVNAMVRIKDRIARSESARIEMLLLVAGTMNIGKALKECGAKDPGRFLLFATSKTKLNKFIKENHVRVLEEIGLEMDKSISGGVALTELNSQ